MKALAVVITVLVVAMGVLVWIDVQRHIQG